MGIGNMKIVYLERNSIGLDISVDCFRQFGDVTEYPYAADAAGTAERIADADIVLVNKAPMNAETLGGAAHVKLICEMATGYDNIDIDYCRSRGIAVANARNYSTTAVAQHTFALALTLLGNIPFYDGYVRSGRYAAQKNFTIFTAPVNELDGKTWGIVGMGNIGRRVAKIAEAFGCRVIFYSASGKSRCTEYPRVEFDELLSLSDVISLHCPLSSRTRHLFDAAAFSGMKKTAVLINVARGGIVDQQALHDALLDGRIAGAGLDVLEAEPMRTDNPLYELRDRASLLITPHMAWASVEARQRDVDISCENIRAFLNGTELNRIV